MKTPRLTISIVSALAAAIAGLTTAAPASAANHSPPRVYKVTAEGTGSFQYDLSLPLGDGLGSETKRSVSFAWKVELPSVVFFSNGEGSALTGVGAAQGNVTGSATEETTIIGSDGHGGKVTTHGYCEAKDASQPAGVARIVPDPYTANPNAGGASITVFPFQSIGFPATCTGKIYGGSTVLNVEAAPEQFQQRFFLPTEATRQGKIIQLVEASPQQRNCPTTVPVGDCKLDWHGTITFEFTGYLGGDGGEVTEDDIVPLPSGGKLSSEGDSASVDVTCGAAPCTGLVRAYPIGGIRRAAAKPLATARFHAPAGKAVKVKLRFRGAARRRVRKAHAIRLVVSAGDAKRSVTVRAPRRATGHARLR